MWIAPVCFYGNGERISAHADLSYNRAQKLFVSAIEKAAVQE